MASRLPVCSGPEAIRALKAAGFILHRIHGSHHIMRHAGPPVRSVTVAVHGIKALKRATLRAIIKQAGLTADDFIALLRGGVIRQSAPGGSTPPRPCRPAPPPP